jgi:phosphoesterase RecJ-like protein
LITIKKPDDYAAYSYSDTSIGSTCEMLYNFISFLGKEDIDKTMELVFTGILTDQAPLGFQEPQEIRTGLFPN